MSVKKPCRTLRPTRFFDDEVGTDFVGSGVQVLIAAPRRRKVRSGRNARGGHSDLRSLAAPLPTNPGGTGFVGDPGSGANQLEAVSRSLSPPQIMFLRSSSPTVSIWCFLSWARLELKKVRPFLFSAIHLPISWKRCPGPYRRPRSCSCAAPRPRSPSGAS